MAKIDITKTDLVWPGKYDEDGQAVDWDFRNDTFMQGLVAYRTRQERKLSLVSDPHVYEKPDRYRERVGNGQH